MATKRRRHSPDKTIRKLAEGHRLLAGGQEYWSWVGTPPGIYFGAAGRGGDHPICQYQGDEPPVGGVDSTADWRHVARDEGHVDW